MNLFLTSLAAGALLLAGLSPSAEADSQKAPPMSHLPLQTKPLAPKEGAEDQKPPSMTHYQPGVTLPSKLPAQTPLPQVEPGQIPTGSGQPTAPDAAQPPSGPDTPGIQTPDHLIPGSPGAPGLPGDAARHQRVVNDLFGDAGGLRDLPGMDGAAVDPQGQLGGREDRLSEQFGDAGGGLDEVSFMPDATTPGESPQNSRGGPGKAPLGPSSPRGAMEGADQQRGRRGGRATAPDGSEMLMSDFRGVRSSPYRQGVIPGSDRSLRLESRDGSTTQVNHFSGSSQIGYDRKHTGADGTVHLTRNRGQETIDVVIQPDGSATKFRNGEEVRPETDPGKGGIASTQDPYEGGDPALALWHYENLYHGPKGTGIQDPNRGPPAGGEDGAAGAPPGTDFDLGDDVVVNPDPTHPAGATGGRLPSAREQREGIEQDHTPGAHPGGGGSR